MRPSVIKRDLLRDRGATFVKTKARKLFHHGRLEKGMAQAHVFCEDTKSIGRILRNALSS